VVSEAETLILQSTVSRLQKRNAEIAEELPSYIANTKGSIATYDYADMDQEPTLKEIHTYVFRRYNLLDRVIRARKLHHSHFYAIDNDYGHAKYLGTLQNERHTLVKALGELRRRAAAISGEQKQWYEWV
jgi:hypothetical protein